MKREANMGLFAQTARELADAVTCFLPVVVGGVFAYKALHRTPSHPRPPQKPEEKALRCCPK
jgi:hypothetical protein